MIEKIDNLNNFYKPIYPLYEPQKLIKGILETIIPKGRKGFADPVLAEDFIKDPTEEDKKLFNKFWINKILSDETTSELYDNELSQKGFSFEQKEFVFSFAIDDIERRKAWSSTNESHGYTASTATSANLILGLFKELIDTENTPWIINTALHLAYGVTRSIRSYYQYSIYGRDDDDAALNQYQADVYGNKIAGALSQASVFTETKINSWAYTVAEILPSHIRDPAKKLLCLPTSMWWRSRMPAHINQQFFTDFLSYLWHRPFSLFGDEKSIRVIKEIKEKDNISLSYFMERHYKNAGLIEKKDQNILNLIKHFFKLTKNTFSSDIKVQKDSSKKLAETIAPVLGMYGFFSVAIGTVFSSALKMFHINSKFFDVINSTSLTSQQMIYLPKIVMPLYNETKELDEAIKNSETTERFSKAGIENLKEFNKEKRNLAYLGFTSLPLSVLNTTLKFFNFEDVFLNKAKNIVDDLSGTVSNRFFSHRRHLIGKQFRLENPEFY